MNVEQARTLPGTTTYVVVALLLTLLTGMEVTVFYVRAVRPVLLPVLLLLSAAKFALVALFYMHLRFDDRTYAVVFVGQLAFAAALIVSLLLLFSVFLSSG
jgi:cytochrome c oxidase subunit 4